MKKNAAIALSKLASTFSKIRKKGGTSIPGMLAQKVDRDILAKLAKNNFSGGIILVTGTNGKTTTAKAIAAILQEANISYVHNDSGSNLPQGIATVLTQKSSLRGKIDAKIALLEVDEAFVSQLCTLLQPRIVVVTNLFRDQLDRYGELDSIAKKFRKAFISKNISLVLNADDPLVASLGMNDKENSTIYFGVEDTTVFTPLKHDFVADSIVAPDSGEKLVYTSRYFGHIGKYTTKSGKFTRPTPSISLEKLQKSDNSELVYIVKKTTELLSIPVKISGIYNAYNILAAIAVANQLDIESAKIESSLSRIRPVFGRAEAITTIDNTKIHIYLIKNPIGFNQVIQSFLILNTHQPLLIAINDNPADGRDISWLWDSAVEDFAQYKGTIILTGTRALDIGLRLKYAGFKNYQIQEELQAAYKTWYAASKEHGSGVVVPTYTAMLQIRTIIRKSNPTQMKEYA